MAFVYGILALAVAIFFVNLYNPWTYLWAYIGATMRLVLEIRKGAVSKTTADAGRKTRV